MVMHMTVFCLRLNVQCVKTGLFPQLLLPNLAGSARMATITRWKGEVLETIRQNYALKQHEEGVTLHVVKEFLSSSRKDGEEVTWRG